MEFLKTSSILIKKESSLNFKQALLKKFSKKSHKSPLGEKSKPLKTNAKKDTKKNSEKPKKQIKPFLTKSEIQMNNKNKKTSEKIKNLLKHIRNNNIKNNNVKNNFKNKSTANLISSPRSAVTKTAKNFEESKSPKVNDFILENNGMNNNINNINVVNVHNSTINICKNKFNIITSKSDENLNNIDVNEISNFNINKNSSISSVVRNNKKTFLYSSSQSPSYRFPYNKELYNKAHYYLNNSNDNIESQNIYIKQKFNCPITNKNNFNIKTNTQKDFFKFEQNKSQNAVSEKCLHNLLRTEPNKFNHINKFYTRNNMNKMSPIEKFKVYEIDYANNENNKNAYNTSKNSNNISQQKSFYTTNHYFYNLNHKRNSVNYINNSSSPKIYIKPSKGPFTKNNISEKILNLSPSMFPLHEPPSPIRNFYFSNVENRTPIISSYRNNENYNKRKSNYFHNVEFKSNTNTNTNEKINKNGRLYEIQKSKTKAYIKKNKDIKFNKRNSARLSLIKNKVSNNINSKVTKYYNYFISRKLIIKRPFYCSKYIKKPKILPLNKRCFATKIIKKYDEKPNINNNIFNNDKIENKNNNINFDNKNNSNVIKANILDFSFEQNKQIIKDNKQKFFYHTDKEQSLGDLNLSFSTDEINTFKYKESTIEDVFNELNNLNTINDSEIKLTFGQENTQNNNYNNNYNISATGGRLLNDVTFHKYNIMNVK